MSALKRWAMRVLAQLEVVIAGLLARRISGGSGGLTVLDIDNTLSDAWPTWMAEWPSHAERLASMRVLPGMKAAAYDTAVERGDEIVFLSHRMLWEWRSTQRWLVANGFAATPGNVVLVPSAADKLAVLGRLATGGRTITYWDDLSHGTERGRTEMYDRIIAEVRTLAVEYHGLEVIEAVVAAAGGREPVK